MEPIILASASPRRREYLELMGLPFICISSPVNEEIESFSDGCKAAEELALRKVKKALEIQKNALWVCGADTLISLNGKLYGKPQNREDAKNMLGIFQAKTHEVISAVVLYNGRLKTFDCRTVVSTVTFAALKPEEIEWYLETGEWHDAAGSYKIQGLASCFITRIEGSYSSIVGLPLREFYTILRDNGYSYGA